MHLISPGYAFTSAYLKGKESRSIAAHHLDGMLQKTALQDALEVIRDTELGDHVIMKAPKTFKEVDCCLWRSLGDYVERLRLLLPPSDILVLIDQYMRKFDVLNIKIALRSVLMEKRASMAPLGLLDRSGSLEELSKAKNVDEVAQVLVKCDLGEYAFRLKSVQEKNERSRVQGEADLDRLYYQSLIRAMKAMDEGRSLTRALGVMIDFGNLQAIFCSAIEEREFLAEGVIEGGYGFSVEAVKELRSRSLSEIVNHLEHTEYGVCAQEIYKHCEMGEVITVVDRIIEKHKFRMLKELLSTRILSNTDIVWHLVLKEMEIRNVRLVLKAVTDNIPAPEIQEYLVIGS